MKGKNVCLLLWQPVRCSWVKHNCYNRITERVKALELDSIRFCCRIRVDKGVNEDMREWCGAQEDVVEKDKNEVSKLIWKGRILKEW